MAITVKHKYVSAVPDSGDTNVVQPSNWNDDHQLTGTVPVANGGTGASTLTGYVKGNGTSPMTASSTIPSTDVTGLGTMATQNANNVAITGGSITGATISGYIPTAEKGVANGVATLDSGGQIPLSQIPPLGDLNYQGTWNASLNVPVLVSSVGVKGYYYVVNVAGSTNLNGITDWQIGDWAVFDGTVWEKIDNTDAVTSVNGYTGTVVLTQPDIAGTVPTSRTISTGTGLTGGGDLSANRTISFSTAAVGTWAATPSSSNLAAAMTDETGSGSLVFGTNPTLANPNIDVVDFDTTYSTTLTAGQLGWDGNNTLALGMAGGNVIQHIGEDTFYYVKASSAITKGQVCMFTGALGASGVITAAPATGVTNGQYIVGIAAENISLNGFGLVQNFGELRNVNTTGFTDGDVVYYDSAVTGGFTKTFPATGPIVTVAAVINGGSAGGGVLQIRITVSERNIAGTGISVSQSSSGSTITNTAPDQTVVLTGGTGISTSGTYPNFTITNTSPSSGGTVTSITAGTGLTGGTITSSGTIAIDSTVATLTGSQILTNKTISGATNTLTNIGNSSLTNSSITINGSAVSLGGSVSVGTVTSVTGTAPISSSGGATPAISISQASGTTNGYLSSTDWTTFNNKGSGSVTSVAASVPSFLSVSGSPITSSGTLAISYSGTALPIANGGTNQTAFTAKSGNVAGLVYFDGTSQANDTSVTHCGYDTSLHTLNAQNFQVNNGIVCNNMTIGTSFSIPSGYGGSSVGPVTVASGQTVTVPSGSRWVVL